MADLRRISQYMCDQTMEDLDVLGHTGPFAMVSNKIDAHLLTDELSV
jgi:hypothetical protein